MTQPYDPPAGLGYPPLGQEFSTQGYPPPGYGPPSGYYPPPPEPPKKVTGKRIVLRIVMTLVTLFAAFCAFALTVSAFSGSSAAPAPTTHRSVPTQQAPAPQAAPTQVPAPVAPTQVPAPTQAPTTQAPTVPIAPEMTSDSTQFGRSAVVGNGLQVQAGIPQAFTPSATAAGSNGTRAFVTEITVRNGTGQALNPTMISVNASVNGQGASSVFDSTQGIGLPTTTVLPGHSVTYRAAFSSPVDHGAVQVDVSPGLTGTASFTGTDL